MAASSKKKSTKKKKTTSRRTRGIQVRPLMWILTFGITLATLALILLLPHKDRPVITQEVHETQVAESRSVPIEKNPQSMDKTQIKPKAFTYEEKIGANFDLRVWEADMAILQTLSLMGHESDRMLHKKVETRFFYGTPYHYQEIVIYTNDERNEFFQKLKQNIERFLSNASLTPTENKFTWSININGQVTHLINLERIVEKPLPGTGRLVIIIDDIGGSLEYAQNLARLDFPIIFSILPYKSETKKVVEFARKNNIETMLHIPMEPVTYSEGVNPGPGGLFVNMDDNEIRRRVKDNLQQVPGVIGANNHMGSRFTQNARGMEIVFDELQKKHLFFLDSLTTPTSVAEKLAQEKELAFLKRHIFLDNVQDEHAILFQLSKAENIAIKIGTAIAIGHPYPETLKALKKWASLRNQNVEVVGVSEMISQQRYRAASRVINSGAIN